MDKLHRSKNNQVLAGVCGGIAETYGIDATLIRVIFVILAIWGGVGVLLYILGILFMPYPGEKSVIESGKIKERVEEAASDIKRNVAESTPKGERGRGGEIIGLIIVLLGVILLLRVFYPSIGMNIFWPIVLILIGILIISGGRKGQR